MKAALRVLTILSIAVVFFQADLASAKVQALSADSSLSEFFKLSVIEGPADIEIDQDSVHAVVHWKEPQPELSVHFTAKVPSQYGALTSAAPSEEQELSIGINDTKDNFGRYVWLDSSGGRHPVTVRADLLSFSDKVFVDPRCESLGIELDSDRDLPANEPSLFLLQCQASEKALRIVLRVLGVQIPNKKTVTFQRPISEIAGPKLFDAQIGEQTYSVEKHHRRARTESFQKNENLVYFELLGRGELFSFNYERVILDRFASGISLSWLPFLSAGDIPLSIFENAYLLSGENRPFVGLGLSAIYAGPGHTSGTPDPKLYLEPALGFEYRTSNPLFFRATAYGILSLQLGSFIAFGGLSVGYTF